jgi:predicted small lipoprotein YifL
MRPSRRIIVLLLGLWLTVIAACGQSGPLTLPTTSGASQAADEDDESEEDDER